MSYPLNVNQPPLTPLAPLHHPIAQAQTSQFIEDQGAGGYSSEQHSPLDTVDETG